MHLPHIFKAIVKIQDVVRIPVRAVTDARTKAGNACDAAALPRSIYDCNALLRWFRIRPGMCGNSPCVKNVQMWLGSRVQGILPNYLQKN